MKLSSDHRQNVYIIMTSFFLITKIDYYVIQMRIVIIETLSNMCTKNANLKTLKMFIAFQTYLQRMIRWQLPRRSKPFAQITPVLSERVVEEQHCLTV